MTKSFEEKNKQTNIFKTYDIRGIYLKEIDELVFYKIARSCAVYFNGKKVLVGCDGRLSSKSLKSSVIQGLLDDGMEVYDLDLVSTSTFNFLISKGDFDFGLHITASHNPKEYNGLKIYDKFGVSIGLGFGLEKIKEIFEKEKFTHKKTGRLIKADDLKEEHKKFLAGKIFSTDKKFAVDFSNGVGSIIFMEILKEIGAECIILNENIDGNFPSHSPEPTEQSLSKLIEIVKSKKLDFGVAFDGDADRIVFIDENGRLLRGDQILYLLVKYLKPKKVVFEASFPPFFKKILQSMNVNSIETKVGRSFIINEMKKSGSDLGGEMSNHFYFKETNFMDDAFYTFLIVLKILEEEKKNLGEILKEYEVGNFLSYKIEVADEKKYQLVEKIKEEVKKKYDVVEVDGVKVVLSEKDWFLIRASNTEPVLKVLIESSKKETIEKYKELIDGLVKKALSLL
ncbi:MAG: hypothetical protein RMJ18_00955 [Candidatus Aenigmarchaeota archaeon]|nr:hypothetical protein [Candidatus Aenigmarchaeota archaeon]MDW8159973.1 hypothetical protein [Candidatus Aenigmarchaeota archaeon]